MGLANKLKKIADDAFEQDKKMLEKYYEKIDGIMMESAKIGNYEVTITFTDEKDKVLDNITNIELQGIKNKKEVLNIIAEHYEQEGIRADIGNYCEEELCSLEDYIIGINFQWK